MRIDSEIDSKVFERKSAIRMVCEDILRIKNFPRDLSDSEKEDFLRHFGAQKVKVLTSNTKQKSVAFAQFETKQIAKSVMLRLHQIKVLNSRLCVEYAEHDIVLGKPKTTNVENLEKNNKKCFRTFINKLNAFNNSVSFNQPPPNHLKYAYPKPNRATINNIAHALASVSKFYTQVLHLMNRMNLPPPFSDIPDPPQPVLRNPQNQQMQSTVKELLPPETAGNSSESELESDPESSDKIKEIIPAKRSRPQKKVIKRPKFIKIEPVAPTTASKTKETAADVFEKTDIQQNKKIELKVSTHSLEEVAQGNNSVSQDVGSFGTFSAIAKQESPQEESTKEISTVIVNFISEEELETNRIPTKDLSVLPVFKNYHPGAPTCRLYIKNIAKTVETKDLEYIYGKYNQLRNAEDTTSQFDIRLMQEGRMKGQAFVTFDSVELAQKALKDTNGYILKEKPLVVVFARSAVPKK